MTSKKRNLALGKVQITSVVDEELVEALDDLAGRVGRSRGSVVAFLLNDALGMSEQYPHFIEIKADQIRAASKRSQ